VQEVEECAVTEPIGVENNSRTVVPHLINARDLAEACASIGPGASQSSRLKKVAATSLCHLYFVRSA
jgi:hypothetical protein